MTILFNSSSRTFIIKNDEGKIMKFLPKTSIKIKDKEQLKVLLKFKEITEIGGNVVLTKDKQIINLDNIEKIEETEAEPIEAEPIKKKKKNNKEIE